MKIDKKEGKELKKSNSQTFVSIESSEGESSEDESEASSNSMPDEQMCYGKEVFSKREHCQMTLEMYCIAMCVPTSDYFQEVRNGKSDSRLTRKSDFSDFLLL